MERTYEDLENGTAFIKEDIATYGSKTKTIAVNSNVKYDLIGKIVEGTGLTRKAVISILQGIEEPVFNQFKDNPDWAIAFTEGSVKHIYFVAETKGSMKSMNLREVERAKIDCAREHFAAISNNEVVYEVIDGYKSLLEKVMK